jgi:hypothetical protein
VDLAVRQLCSETGTRLRYSGAVAIALRFTSSLAVWNLLGWRL